MMSMQVLLLPRPAWPGLLLLVQLLLFFLSLCHRGHSSPISVVASPLSSVDRDDIDRGQHHDDRHLVERDMDKEERTLTHSFLRASDMQRRTWDEEDTNKAGGSIVVAHQHRGEPAGINAIGAFPTVAESTVLFLHVFKCAGTSLRSVMIAWAHSQGRSGAVVEECRNVKRRRETRICLNKQNDLLSPKRQLFQISRQKVLAGHFFWGFRRYVRRPYLMITTLRNPLVLFVSGQQFMHREETNTVENASAWVTVVMESRSRSSYPLEAGFTRRFLDPEVWEEYKAIDKPTQKQADALVAVALDNLRTFWVVGVVDQYVGFLEVLRHCLDPNLKQPDLWRQAHSLKDNGSPVGSREVLDQIDAGVVATFNSSVLSLHWQLYEVALELWDSRCREVLPAHEHDTLCAVVR